MTLAPTRRLLVVFSTLWFLMAACPIVTLGQAKVPTDKVAANPATKEAGKGSVAERIAGIGHLIDADQQRQAQLEESLNQLERDFNSASAEFSTLDSQLTEQKAKAKAAPDKQEAAEQKKALVELEAKRNQSRDRFDRIIKRRQAFQEQLDILKEKISVAESAHDRATRIEAKPEKLPTVNPADPSQKEAVASPAEAKKSDEGEKKSEAPATNSAFPWLPLGQGAADQSALKSGDATDHVIDERVREAQKVLANEEAKLADAQQDLVNRDRAIDVFKRDLESARQILKFAEEDLQVAKAAQGSDEESKGVIDRAAQRAQQETDRLTQSEKLLSNLEESRTKILERIEKASSDVSSARLQLQFLQSPIAPHQLTRWIMRAGPRIISILIAMFFFWWLSRLLAQRIVTAVIRRSSRGSDAEREGRAETLRRVFQSTASSAILTLGILALLDQAGVNVTVLLGGAAVLGAAIAFGSQNLIKDYFSGFMILVENQYSVGNVVKIGAVSGAVEDITLRMTVIRDEEGVLHFLPHSQVAMVSNMTHGWSRAVFRISVGYQEDVDRVMAVLMEVAREMTLDATFKSDILGDPEMQGVDNLADSAVIIKFLVKTRPMRQWAVKRELLRRIKRRFDRDGIEIPYPTQITYNRIAENAKQSDASEEINLARNGRH